MFKKEIEIKHLPIGEKLEKIEKGEAHWFFPHHVFEQVIIILLIMGAMISLVTLFPPHLGEKADPFVTPEHIKPEWYFLAGYQFLKAAEIFEFLGRGAPKVIGVIGQGLIIFLLVIFPFFDRHPDRRPSRRPIATLIGIMSAVGFIVMTIWGYYS
jgi:quinol-cytochrome oxidoreductase complex cytochrome b subunit